MFQTNEEEAWCCAPIVTNPSTTNALPKKKPGDGGFQYCRYGIADGIVIRRELLNTPLNSALLGRIDLAVRNLMVCCGTGFGPHASFKVGFRATPLPLPFLGLRGRIDARHRHSPQHDTNSMEGS